VKESPEVERQNETEGNDSILACVANENRVTGPKYSVGDRMVKKRLLPLHLEVVWEFWPEKSYFRVSSLLDLPFKRDFQSPGGSREEALLHVASERSAS
jgi:hypothetical protein